MQNAPGVAVPKSAESLTPSNLDPNAIIRLTHRKRKQAESVSGQNRIARCKVIERDPSIANPDHPWWHVVRDMSLCPKLSLLIVNLDRITAGQLSRFSIDPGDPKLRRCVVFCEGWQGSALIVK